MLKINLAIKEEKGGKLPQEWIVVGFFAAVTIFIMLGITFSNKGKITTQRDEITQKKDDLKKLEAIITQINNLKKQKTNLEKKNKVIDELNRGRQIWPKIMRMLVETKPEQLWVKVVNGSSKQIQLEGSCFSHLNVAQFMENLKNNPMVANVTLNKTIAAGVRTSGGGELVNFSLQINLK